MSSSQRNATALIILLRSNFGELDHDDAPECSGVTDQSIESRWLAWAAGAKEIRRASQHPKFQALPLEQLCQTCSRLWCRTVRRSIRSPGIIGPADSRQRLPLANIQGRQRDLLSRCSAIFETSGLIKKTGAHESQPLFLRETEGS